jgi:cyclic beta-1,2-glucan synthetase
MPHRHAQPHGNEDILHEHLIRREVFSPERLEQYAEKLAIEQVARPVARNNRLLGKRLDRNEQQLRVTYLAISKAIGDGFEMPPAADWVVDNYFIVEEQIRAVRNDLPPQYYRELPRLMQGDLMGFPRVYGIAVAYIAHTDSFFNPQLIESFVRAYQCTQPLNINELWALAITLRAGLVENLCRAASLIIADRKARAQADALANDLLNTVEAGAKGIEAGLRSIGQARLTPSFAVQLIQRLRDQDPRVIPFLQYLDRRLQEKGSSAHEIVSAAHLNQGALTVTVRNIITSMRLISTFDWVEFIEKVSHVDAILRAESGFGAMDLPTRNLYRRAIEKLARRSKLSEIHVAERAIWLAQDAQKQAAATTTAAQRTHDPGYYLVDLGRARLETDIGYRRNGADRLRESSVAINFFAYMLANILLVIGIIELSLLGTVLREEPRWIAILPYLAIFFPAWEAAITIVNRLTLTIFAPSILPGMALRDGIPDDLRTMVVMPVLLGTKQDIAALIEHLEVHYLSNADNNLRFALLSDWKDADREVMPADAELFTYAIAGVAALNARHPLPENERRFYLLHRRRQWNAAEQTWMGWERKRGKLHELNSLLRGATNTSFDTAPAIIGARVPENIRYVVTLDADTRLPRDVVRRLVGKMAHPLNRAYFDLRQGCVVEGYGILQPRVSSSLPERHADSLFQRIFYRASGIDPYAFAISDVYQDLFGEGSFTGKGIYDIDAFESAVTHRIPENTVLSHDLIEGIFARAGLASDIEVVEEYPARYDVASTRQHRWARGDWQLLPWIFGTCSGDIPSLGHWKMVDNLRRTLTAAATFIALVLGWTLPLGNAALWTSLIIAAYSMPLLISLIESALSRPRHLTLLVADCRRIAQQMLFYIAFMPHQAWIMLDAIMRTLWRLYVSHRRLLEWTSTADSELRQQRTLLGFYRYMAGSLMMVAGSGVMLVAAQSTLWHGALFFLLLWAAAPALAYYSSLPTAAVKKIALESGAQRQLRRIGRETWRYFEQFITAQDNWLPPDNFQEDPYPRIAHRTSPTNIGLYFLSAISAADFGWMTLLELLDRLENSFATLQRMELYRGNFYNWYDTTDLRPLEPRYVSTVDSGNLAGHLLVVAQMSQVLPQQRILAVNWREGLGDTLEVLLAALHHVLLNAPHLVLQQAQANVQIMHETLQKHLNETQKADEIYCTLTELQELADTNLDIASLYVIERGDKASNAEHSIKAWCGAVATAIQANLLLLQQYMPWLAQAQLMTIMHQELRAVLVDTIPTLSALTRLPQQVAAIIADQEASSGGVTQSVRWPEAISLQELVRQGARAAEKMRARADAIAVQANAFFQAMEFRFLLNPERKLLSIGLRVADNVLDSSCYDLLASEARLAFVIAIAKGDIPAHCWFRLGRTVTAVDQKPALVSWSGSMFEYLMPTLIMNEPDASLVGQTNHLIIKRQIDYGEALGIPWGVSESAYSARDFEMTYQYSSFGIPGLGLKRGLSENVVIAPYATALAAMIDPHSALKNYHRLTALGAHGYYGWYDAIDFTLQRLPKDKQWAVIYNYMAHHQGMSLVAIANILLNGRMRDRFHADPLIQATELLLQELPPRNVAFAEPRFEEVESIAPIRAVSPANPRSFTSPHSLTPPTHLLANGHYSLMLTAAGGGYSKWRDTAITRWREDPTRDCWGSFIYIRDMQSGRFWSSTYQPTDKEPDDYAVTFHEDHAEYQRRDGDITTNLNIIVSPEDHGEVRHLCVTNHGDVDNDIELTSYAELVLTTVASDMAHPAFAKMFIETEFVPALGALLATRRRRNAEESPIWAVHLIAIGDEAVGETQYETDRARFLGRGHTPRHPVAMDGRPLSDTTGTVLDPIFSLRCRVHLKPHASTRVSFWTLVATSRQEAIELAHKYRSYGVYDRTAARAWTLAQLQYQHLGITPDEAHLFQRLANPLIYSDPAFRPKSEMIKAGANTQSTLWPTGISGDIPILLLRVDVATDMKTLRQIVKAHGYLAMKGLEYDLVIINEQPTSYLAPLQQEMELLVRTRQAWPGAYGESGKGKIYVLRGDQIAVEARNLLQAAARVVLMSHRGSLAEQLDRHARTEVNYFPSRTRRPVRAIAAATVRPELEYFNGIGGFAAHGREYVTILTPGQHTPAPWINVLANPGFGSHVSADGAAYTWSGNSRENKLTPWSNDPVSNESGEAIYLVDQDSGEIWSPTATPLRKDAVTYIARHGMGYSSFEATFANIFTQSTQFVPLNDTVKVTRLRLVNQSALMRRIAVTSYNDWVLGVTGNSAAGLIITAIDQGSGAIFARNAWTHKTGDDVAFAHLGAAAVSSTGDRREFIGRNGTYQHPHALTQNKALRGAVGAGLDPCAALQTTLILKPHQETELIILLGIGTDAAAAQRLIQKYTAQYAATALQEVKDYWRDMLGQIQVKTPDRATDIMLNGWLLYQTIACRMWARSAFYQTSGAYGFRDQLQDVMTVVHCQPQWTRQHILRAAARQFTAGDVQHWWLPATTNAGQGIRTRFADDALWLPYVTAAYIQVTGDTAILDEIIPFLDGRALADDEQEAFYLPTVSAETATLLEHCARAIDRSLISGTHGLSLFGGGDWNDGMNRVGQDGKGESVWLSWFLISTIKQFEPLADKLASERRAQWQEHAANLAKALEQNAWDGEWYRRGYYDDGMPLGSAASEECRIDSIAQSWAVISGAAPLDRATRAMRAVEQYLHVPDEGLALLFKPAFNLTAQDPGYIKAYPPGVRENGGQYTHAALWSVFAFAQLGQTEKAFALFSMLNPIEHTESRMAVFRYKVEPYVVAADIYANPQHMGRGGWTWYTGSAGWMYRAGIEAILGLQVRGALLRVAPCIPQSWPGFELSYRYKSAQYHIKVENQSGLGHTVTACTVDGVSLVCDANIQLYDDGNSHTINLVL